MLGERGWACVAARAEGKHTLHAATEVEVPVVQDWRDDGSSVRRGDPSRAFVVCGQECCPSRRARNQLQRRRTGTKDDGVEAIGRTGTKDDGEGEAKDGRGKRRTGDSKGAWCGGRERGRLRAASAWWWSSQQVKERNEGKDVGGDDWGCVLCCAGQSRSNSVRVRRQRAGER